MLVSVMSWLQQKKGRVDLDEFKDIDEDVLVETLSPEEIADLNAAIDPENALLPVNERQANQTNKASTGPFDRQHLLNHLEEQAKNEKERDDYVPYKKETRGKVWRPKEKSAKKEPEPMLPDDLSEVLDNATEEEMLELAAILGVHSMLTQSQSNWAEKPDAGKALRGSGLKKYKPGLVKATKIKKPDLTAVNELNVSKAMDQLKNNDPKLTSLNLNNHPEATAKVLQDIAEALLTNTSLKHVHLANTQMTDRIAKLFADVLNKNKTLETLNLESNFLTGVGIMEVMEALETNTTLQALRLSNQCSVIGSQVEQKMVNSLQKNKTLLNFGMSFDTQGPRIRAAELMLRNNDSIRQERVENDVNEDEEEEDDDEEEEEDDDGED